MKYVSLKTHEFLGIIDFHEFYGTMLVCMRGAMRRVQSNQEGKIKI